MKAEIAFIGDVHGNLDAVIGIWHLLDTHKVQRVVFLGDYINKGARSAQVLEFLTNLEREHGVMLLAGNHEQVLLEALDTGDLRAFLKMGGAATIKSYHGGSVGPDVLTNFVASIPPRHLQSLRAMPSRFELPGLLAQHHPPTPPLPNCYTISAHAQVGPLPRIGPQAAELDTGCGTPGGRLTAMLWPCRGILQVDEKGVPVT